MIEDEIVCACGAHGPAGRSIGLGTPMVENVTKVPVYDPHHPPAKSGLFLLRKRR